jgi:hypothetical protein
MSNRRKRDMGRIVTQGSLATSPILMAGSVYTTPPEGNVAQGSLSSLAAFPPHRDFGGATSR